MLYELYMQAGQPSLEEIATYDDQSDPISHARIMQIIGSTQLPRSETYVIDVATILAHMARQSVPKVTGRIHAAWLILVSSSPEYGIPHRTVKPLTRTAYGPPTLTLRGRLSVNWIKFLGVLRKKWMPHTTIDLHEEHRSKISVHVISAYENKGILAEIRRVLIHIKPNEEIFIPGEVFKHLSDRGYPVVSISDTLGDWSDVEIKFEDGYSVIIDIRRPARSGEGIRESSNFANSKFGLLDAADSEDFSVAVAKFSVGLDRIFRRLGPPPEHLGSAPAPLMSGGGGASE
ncbi:hypothetical protein [Planobispora rosea]|uniref:hypothetical protein n=1 Tax=Planobispora rosea TaxID=35762 RepID=UPI00114CB290|nr:hypothetical protein [Planobispora rosea]